MISVETGKVFTVWPGIEFEICINKYNADYFHVGILSLLTMSK